MEFLFIILINGSPSEETRIVLLWDRPVVSELDHVPTLELPLCLALGTFSAWYDASWLGR